MPKKLFYFLQFFGNSKNYFFFESQRENKRAKISWLSVDKKFYLFFDFLEKILAFLGNKAKMNVDMMQRYHAPDRCSVGLVRFIVSMLIAVIFMFYMVLVVIILV